MLLYKGGFTGVLGVMGSANPINFLVHPPTDAVFPFLMLGSGQHGRHLLRCVSSGIASNARIGLGIG